MLEGGIWHAEDWSPPEGRPLFARALAVRERVLRPHHPDGAETFAIVNLTRVRRQSRGRWPAIQLVRRVGAYR